jgi:hypothetical protein
LAAVRYLCLYWVDHLYDGGHDNVNDDLREDGLVEESPKQRYLFWLEAISLRRYILEGIIVMAKLNRFLYVNGHLYSYYSAILTTKHCRRNWTKQKSFQNESAMLIDLSSTTG